METIRDKEFGGERPLFGTRGLHLENVTFHAGESALKCCADIEAEKCRFEGKYPFWHTDGFKVRNSLFTPGARAALWYSRNLEMTDTQVNAPKMFREMDGIVLRNVNIPDAEETLWHCANVDIRDVKVANADYLFMHSHDIRIENWHQQGNYSFQYCRNVEIRNAEIHSKDAFWGTENVTIYDSVISGEYLGWHSRRLHLVRCRISGTQPLRPRIRRQRSQRHPALACDKREESHARKHNGRNNKGNHNRRFFKSRRTRKNHFFK